MSAGRRSGKNQESHLSKKKSFHRGWLRPYFGDKLLEAPSQLFFQPSTHVSAKMLKKDLSFFTKLKFYISMTAIVCRDIHNYCI